MSVPQYGSPESPVLIADGHVRFERLPARLHVARPDESAVPLHARRRVAMQRVRPLVRPIQLRAFPIHPMPIEPRRAVEAVALIGPPAVDADDPSAACAPASSTTPAGRAATDCPASVPAAAAARCTDRSPCPSASPFDHDVQHDLEMLGVQLVEHLLRARESSSDAR